MTCTPQEVLAHYGIQVVQNFGSEVRCLCPFHDDHRPSFDVNIEKDMWVCRAGCGGGSMETLVMRMENVPLAVARVLLDHNFVLYEGGPEDEFQRRHAEVARGMDEDVPVVMDTTAKKMFITAVLRTMCARPELSPQAVNDWTRVLVYILSDTAVYAKDVYFQLQREFLSSMEVR